MESRRHRLTWGEMVALKDELNEEQLVTLLSVEKFGWELKFIRRPMFERPIPVVFDADRKAYAVLGEDGNLDEHPDIDIRH